MDIEASSNPIHSPGGRQAACLSSGMYVKTEKGKKVPQKEERQVGANGSHLENEPGDNNTQLVLFFFSFFSELRETQKA